MVTSRKALLVSTPAPMKLIVISVSLRRSRALLAGPALFPSVNSGNCTDVWRGDPAWRPGYRAIVGDLGANGRPRRLSTPNFSDREQIRSRFIGDPAAAGRVNASTRSPMNRLLPGQKRAIYNV